MAVAEAASKQARIERHAATVDLNTILAEVALLYTVKR
jgi:hypothetical protein